MRLLLLICVHLSLVGGELSWEAVPQPARNLVDEILQTNTALEPELDAAGAHQAFVHLVATLQPQIDPQQPQASIAALNKVILADRHVSYLSNQYWRDSSFVAALMRGKGNCLATTTLYVAVARALNLPVHAVLVPSHAFVCWSQPELRVNIETTAGGRAQSDWSYQSRFATDIQDYDFYNWMAPLGDDRLVAELEIIAAEHLAGQQEYAQARGHLTKARAVLPKRRDLDLLDLKWAADISRNRAPLVAAAEAMAADQKAPRPAILAALRTLALEYSAHLDRATERGVLMRAWSLAPWHEQDEILEQLSVCLRGLRDHTGAALCMELAVAKDPDNLYKQAWLAGMLVEAKRMEEGLALIAKVRAQNPEEVYFANMQAGLLVTAGKRDEGRRIFDALQAPRTGLEGYQINRAWFLAVWGDRTEFYPQFEKAMGMAADPSVISWIAEDDDLDPYRQESHFQQVVETCRKRLLGDNKPVASP